MSQSSSSENPLIQYVRGFPFVNHHWFKKQNIEESLDYVARDDDIVLASYPKTGTTLMQYILIEILFKGENFPQFYEAMVKVMPMMEAVGKAAIDQLEKPRAYKHHIPYNMVKKNPKAKYIYIYRRPEDTIVSYYHFLQQVSGVQMDFNQFFEDFLAGNVSYGIYFDHVLSYAGKDVPNVLLISYEKMQANKRDEILRIAKFMGEEYYQNLLDDKSALDRVIHHTSFDYMKQNLVPPSYEREDSEIDFAVYFRKGKVGEGKNLLSEDQLKRLKELTVEKMSGTKILQKWLSD